MEADGAPWREQLKVSRLLLERCHVLLTFCVWSCRWRWCPRRHVYSPPWMCPTTPTTPSALWFSPSASQAWLGTSWSYMPSAGTLITVLLSGDGRRSENAASGPKNSYCLFYFNLNLTKTLTHVFLIVTAVLHSVKFYCFVITIVTSCVHV